MMIRGSDIKNRHIRQLACFIGLAVFTGCVEPALDELTLMSPYAHMVGGEYRTLAEVNAYGIYENLDKKVISYITVIPGVGISGPEVAFKRRIAKGQNIKILSAWREHKVLHSGVYYVVAFQDADLPRDIQVRIELSRGNEGVGAELNQHIYERLTR